MKTLSLGRALMGAAVTVVGHVAGRTLFRALYALVPEYHSFWSGVVLYTGILGIWWAPAALTFVVLRGRTRFAGVASGLVGGCFIVALGSTASSDGSGWYRLVYAVLVAAVYIGAAVQRRYEPIDRNRDQVSPLPR